jgi:hypothetical protein
MAAFYNAFKKHTKYDTYSVQKRGKALMMPRPHPETNENQHKRFAQHIGPPCHGAHAMGLAGG